MVGEGYVELAGGFAGLSGEGGVGDDEGDGGVVDGFRGVGLLYGVVADGMGVELALDDRRAGRGVGEKIRAVVAGLADTNDGDVRADEDVGDKALVVRAGFDGAEIVGGFEGGTFGAAKLPRLVDGSDLCD